MSKNIDGYIPIVYSIDDGDDNGYTLACISIIDLKNVPLEDDDGLKTIKIGAIPKESVINYYDDFFEYYHDEIWIDTILPTMGLAKRFLIQKLFEG